MKALLKESCKNCTPSSRQTYYYAIKALAKIAGHNDAPTHGQWLTDTLLHKVKQKPLIQFKRLAIAGVKALHAYHIKSDSKKC